MPHRPGLLARAHDAVDETQPGAVPVTAPGRGLLRRAVDRDEGGGSGGGIHRDTSFDIEDIEIGRFPIDGDLFGSQNLPLLAAPGGFIGGILAAFFGPYGVVGADPSGRGGPAATAREIELGRVSAELNRMEPAAARARFEQINMTVAEAAATRQRPEGSPRGLATGRSGGSQPGADLGIGGDTGGDRDFGRGRDPGGGVEGSPF